MEGLRKKQWMEPIHQFVQKGRPILGICLGVQLFLSESFEFGQHPGLSLIPGQVVKLQPKREVKIPHVGWASIYADSNQLCDAHRWEKTLLKKTKPGTEFYFVHSFVCQPKHSEDVLAVAFYGDTPFAAAIKKGNIMGCQFHPEKSGVEGLKVLQMFLNLK